MDEGALIPAGNGHEPYPFQISLAARRSCSQSPLPLGEGRVEGNASGACLLADVPTGLGKDGDVSMPRLIKNEGSGGPGAGQGRYRTPADEVGKRCRKMNRTHQNSTGACPVSKARAENNYDAGHNCRWKTSCLPSRKCRTSLSSWVQHRPASMENHLYIPNPFCL